MAKFERPVPGCIETNLWKYILVGIRRWKALEEIYKIYKLLNRSAFKNSAKFRRKQFSTAKQPSRGRLQTLHDGIRNPTAKRRGRPPKTRPAPGGASSVVFGDELSQAFEQEMASDADASARLMLMPESQLKRSGSNPLQSEVNSIIHPNFAAVQNVAKPVAQLEAHSVSNTTK